MSSLILAAACLIAAPVAAQQVRPANGQTPGMRYLSWAGKGEVPARPQATPVATAADGLRRPSPVTDRRTAAAAAPAGVASTPVRSNRYGSIASGGLTPASAWLPAPASRPTPSVVAATPAASHVSPPSQPRPIPEATPVRGAVATPQPQAAADAPASEAPPATSEFDPMAPRRDALIYRIQGAQPAETAPQARPLAAAEPQAASTPSPYALADQSRGGARYYSVHRAAGHQPDRTVIPEAVYLDSAPIDLAEPPATPVPARTVNGRAQVIVPNEDPSLP